MIISPSGITINYGGSAGVSRPVVATIIGPSSSLTPARHRMVVPPGESVEQRLESGTYSVELLLPSGRLIQRNVRIDEDANETFKFLEDFAPDQQFSLQEAAADEPGRIVQEAAKASSGGDLAPTGLVRKGMIGRLVREAFGFQQRASSPPVADAGLSVSLRRGEFRPGALRAPRKLSALQAAVGTRGGGLWRIPGESTHGGYSQDDRMWVVVELPKEWVEVASLPLPWVTIADYGTAGAEVLVDPARATAASTVAVRDARMGTLLAFLDRGQAALAAPVLLDFEKDRLIEDAIYEKMVNPLASCAAAYVSLTMRPGEYPEKWDRWLANLMDRFGDIPDSSIVHARRLVLRPSSGRDNAAAAAALRQAFRAGVPYFSMGVTLLREMLVQLSPDFPDLAELAQEVGALSGRVDHSQAFTVMRFRPEEIER